MAKHVWLIGVGVLLAGMMAAGAPAAEPAPQAPAIPEGTLPPNFPSLEQILTQAVKNIARRYNLNQEQEAFTLDLMLRGVYRFLQENQTEVWPVIRDLAAIQMGRDPTAIDVERLKRLGKAGRPIMEKAKKAIFDANREWAEKLTPQQRTTHERDLKDMEQAFAEIDQNLHNWENGNPTQKSIFPAARVDPNQLPKPVQPAPGLPKVGFAEIQLGLFETRVEEFIKDYELDQAQIETARSIMREYQEKARNYLNSVKADLERVTAARDEAEKKHDSEALRKANEEYGKLREPVSSVFIQMEDRLQALLTQAQKDRYAAKQKAGTGKPQPAPKAETPVKPEAPKAETPTKPEAPKPETPPPAAEAGKGDKPAAEGSSTPVRRRQTPKGSTGMPPPTKPAEEPKKP